MNAAENLSGQTTLWRSSSLVDERQSGALTSLSVQLVRHAIDSTGGRVTIARRHRPETALAVFTHVFISLIDLNSTVGAFDRFVYIHGHAPSSTSAWSTWCRHISTKTGSMILLILPVLCSLPLAVCNALHAHIHVNPFDNQICIVQYNHGLLIGLLLSFYILPLLFAFFLHGKLIYFIRTRHDQLYLIKSTYVVPMKRYHKFDSQSLIVERKQRALRETGFCTDHGFIKSKSSDRRPMTMNTDTLVSPTGSTTATSTITASMVAVRSRLAKVGQKSSSNSSHSSRSSTATANTSKSLAPSLAFYKSNSQANSNANRTVLLLVLLLSFYVCCWAPYNVYTWHHAYRLTHPSNIDDPIVSYILQKNDSSSHDHTIEIMSSLSNRHADLRRIIFMNYFLYLLSMISMCFSFIFYFCLNKQARHQFSRSMACLCPRIRFTANEPHGQRVGRKESKRSRRPQCQGRAQQPYPYKHERIRVLSPPSFNERFNHVNTHSFLPNGKSKRTAMNYGCEIQCCA